MKDKTIAQLLATPIVPVFYSADVEYTINCIEACYKGGMRAFEFTNRGDDAIEVFAAFAPKIKETCPGMLLGIGTVVDAATAEKYVALGVDFIVQPGSTLEVAEVCHKHNIPWIPGVMTPTEIYAALNNGADMVKIFPGNILGSEYISSLRGPMKSVKMMVTGGVSPTEENLDEWFKAGVNAVGMGSQLFKNLDNFDTLSDTVRRILAHIQPYIK
jgi:2-dehydro-3-deoxyphosphogluconate aldolase / (4S)-4-hydroxy-2-oxoglutarate aldolase